MLMIYEESENIYVDKSIFDTIDSENNLAYLFGTGTEDRTQTYQFGCKNVYVSNSKFLNNTKWEGIDTHCCNGFYCFNNYIENCNKGIMAIYDARMKILEEEKHNNIYIENNIIIGGETSNNTGIIAGADRGEECIPDNIVIKNNKIDKFPNADNSTIGAITLKLCKNAQVIGNIITNCVSRCMYLECCLYSNIVNNVLNTSSANAINVGAGTSQINIRNNKINMTSTGVTTAIYGSLSHIVNLVDNQIKAQNYYNIKGTNTTGLINQYTTEKGKIGNYIMNQYGVRTHYCTDTVIKAKTSNSITSTDLSGESGTNIVNGNNSMYYFTENEEITIPGAGIEGADLTTTITKFIDVNKFEIADNISTSFSNVNGITSAGTWIQI
jgi:hypothetical protein